MRIKEKLSFLVKLSHLFNKKERLQLAGIMAIALLTAIFQSLGIASILPFISLLMNPDIIFEHKILFWIYNFFGFQNVKAFIIGAGLAILGIIVIGNIISAMAIWLQNRFVWKKNNALSTALLGKYLSLPYSYFLTQNTADLSKNVLSEVNILTISFLMPILDIITGFVIICLIFSTLLLISPLSTVIIFLIFFMFSGVIYKSGFRRKLKARGNERIKANEGRYKAASEAFGAIKYIKFLGRETYFSNKYANHSLKFSDLLAWRIIVSLVPRYFIEIIAFGGVIAFILLLMITERSIQQIIPVTSFFAFAGYRIMPIMNKMFMAFTNLQFNRVVLDKIHKDLIENGYEKSNAETDSEEEKNLRFESSIVFKNLSFSYSGSSDFVLKHINLKIKKNMVVGIVGPTGAGKTTFVDIVLGLLTPTEGIMEVDGIKITDVNLKGWKHNLGYVPQFIYLSDDTITHNIAFGFPDEMIDMKRVERVAKISNLHDFITIELPERYNTIVGERGIRLSGGQKQRVGIARALYEDPDVLILDEATSSLDGITEKSVLKAIENISELKTLIIIAHRLTTVKKCDVIYLLDNGSIVAQGRYDELMENNLQFRAMASELRN